MVAPSRICVVVAVMLAACHAPAAVAPPVQTSPGPTAAPDPAPPSTVNTENEGAAERFAALEAAMLSGEHRLRFEIEATGAVVANFTGQLVVTADALDISARGAFAGEPAHLELHADGRGVRGGHVEDGPRFELPPTDNLRAAVVLGATRMGLLHNLALLVGGRAPDGLQGAFDDFAHVESVTEGVGTKLSHVSASGQPLSFSLVVKGQPAGVGTLWSQTSPPAMVERHLVVPFGDEQMQVIERYGPL